MPYHMSKLHNHVEIVSHPVDTQVAVSGKNPSANGSPECGVQHIDIIKIGIEQITLQMNPTHETGNLTTHTQQLNNMFTHYLRLTWH